MFFTKNSKNSDKITHWRWFLHKSDLYFVSYSSRSKTCVFDINEPKSYQNGSKVPLWPHILTQFDEINRLVYDLTIYDELFFGCFLPHATFTLKNQLFFIYTYSVKLCTIWQISSNWVRMCGQSGTLDPFWYDLGSFMSKTHCHALEWV